MKRTQTLSFSKGSELRWERCGVADFEEEKVDPLLVVTIGESS